MYRSLSQEISSAAKDGKLGGLDDDTVLNWIQRAVEMEEVQEQVSFVKSLILRKREEIQAQRSSFTAFDIAPMLGCQTEAGMGIVFGALHEMSSEECLILLDRGKPAIYSFR